MRPINVKRIREGFLGAFFSACQKEELFFGVMPGKFCRLVALPDKGGYFKKQKRGPTFKSGPAFSSRG
jgi:hypothetical protein